MLLCNSVPTLVSIVHMSSTYGVLAQPQAIWNSPSNLGGNRAFLLCLVGALPFLLVLCTILSFSALGHCGVVHQDV